MGASTGIEWTDATWNPWRGCTKVSPGCKNCYMFREQRRYGRDPSVVVRASPATFNAPLRWESQVEHNLISVGPVLQRKPLVFTCSWSDFFHEAADPWREEAWSIIRKTPDLTYQILTKRPERISSHLPTDWGPGYPNVWLGVSGETVAFARQRGEILRGLPARLRFLSAEPWLETDRQAWREMLPVVSLFDWVILGGESGPHARKMDERTATALRVATQISEIPFFFKQWGGPVGAKRDHEDAVLDGRTWKEMPDR
jgi:protein gp37